MEGCIPELEKEFFDLFLEFFDSEKDAGRQHDPANYSLERMYPLAELAGNPEQKLRIVHVAGTKGKGSTSHFISSLLASAGYRTGLFTSPHLRTVRERIQINNSLPEYGELITAGREFVTAVKSAGLTPSLFEIFTLLSMRMFAEHGAEWAVMETGIGGRLDATNYVEKPEITVITPVSFDHTALLGSTIREIAAEKAGILKPGVPLVLAEQPFPEAEDVILQRAGSLNVPVLRPDSSPGGFLPEEFPGFLRANFAVAYRAVQVLNTVPVRERFKLPVLPARFECISREPLVIIDGAHNGDSMEKLADALNKKYPEIQWTVVLGAVKGKDVKGMTAALKNLRGAKFILTNPRTGKGSALEELRAAAAADGLDVTEIIPELTGTEQLPENKPLLFTGSFFTAFIGDELYGHRQYVIKN